MSTYRAEGMKATLTTATPDDGERWNGFAVPMATRQEVEAFIDLAVELDGVAREDMNDAFASPLPETGTFAVDGHAWEVVGPTEISAIYAEALMAEDPITAALTIADAKYGRQYTNYVTLDNEAYIEGHFKGAYESKATELGYRPEMSVIYVGEVGTDGRMLLIRTTIEGASIALEIARDAEARVNV